MRSQSLRVAFLLAAMLLFTASANADTIDQSSVASGLTAIFNGCCGFIAQTYTAGLTGSLTGINIDIYFLNQSSFPMLIEIRTVSGGLPTSTVLTSTTLAAGQTSPLSQLITFPTAIAQIAGTEYAIVVSFTGTAPPSHLGGSWGGGTGNPYLAGDSFGSSNGNGGWFNLGPGNDLNFQTHVNVVPEPGTLALLGTGVVTLWTSRRKWIHKMR